ncbi:2,3-bisphosphoglycerate-dependent phosphoglycerate mutase [uncultured archaeon]|nr:2,3-bisphosphoglycerate-dependent phosphoglycerate mutase [uncultured archaeon]
MVDTIFIVRHGEAESNLGKYFGGWLDVPLTPLGKQQASVLKKRLAHEKIGRAFCSDLLRARETLAGIGIDCPTEYTRELREKSYGELEGVRFDNETKYDKYHTDAYVRAPNGENCVDVQRRVVAYLKRKVYSAKEEKVLVVSHHGPIVLLACDLLGMPLKNWRRLRLGNCGLTILTKEDGIWRLKLWNSLSHYGLQNFKPLLQREGKIGKIK